MLQHARDLGRVARQRGPWHVAILCSRLLKDGIVNAAIEHVEVMRMASNRYTPVPWLSVILAALPGLLIAVSRRHATLLDPLLPILGYLYLALVLFAVPVVWWKKRRFPEWALLPAGTLIWFLTFAAGSGLWRLVDSLHIVDLQPIGNWTWITLINLVLAATLFVVLLRNRRVPGSARLVFCIMVFGNVLMAVLYILATSGGTRLFLGVLQYLTTSGLGSLQGLMLVAVGLLAARQHGVGAVWERGGLCHGRRCFRRIGRGGRNRHPIAQVFVGLAQHGQSTGQPGLAGGQDKVVVVAQQFSNLVEQASRQL